jgi:hypothetical protein
MRYLAACPPLFFLCAHLAFVVPIYDGRDVDGGKEFMYSSADFSKINSWPLYVRGLRDLPCDSLVTVGYTVNTFGGDATWGATSLLMNIHFVILLALPVDSQE